MKTKKQPPIHPGEILAEEFLGPMGISQYRLAKDIGVPPRRVNEIVHGLRAVSADTALRLGRYFSVPAQFWINLQSHYDLAMADERIGASLEHEVRVWTSGDENSDIPPPSADSLALMQIGLPRKNVPSTIPFKSGEQDWQQQFGDKFASSLQSVANVKKTSVPPPAMVRESASPAYQLVGEPSRPLADGEVSLDKPRRMTLRKDIGFFVNTRLPIRSGLLDLDLGFREKEGAPVHSLGRFRLNLPRLLALGHIRYVKGSRAEVVFLLRLNPEGMIGIQTRNNQPFWPLARVPTGT